MTLIYFFYTTGALLILLLAFKSYECAHGKRIGEVMRMRADVMVRNFLQNSVRFLFRVIHRCAAYLKQKLHVLSFAFVALLRRSVERRLLSLLNLVRGRGEIKRRGSTSLFLKSVSHYKGTLRRQ